METSPLPPFSGGPRPVVIGLLGGIASGKSAVAKLLGERGAKVIDADSHARAVLEESAVISALVERHGPTVTLPGGNRIDRAALASKTFGRPAELEHLESLIHPRVRRMIGRALAAALGDATLPAVVLDVPLLLERPPFSEWCDLLLFVAAGDETRDHRATTGRGWDPAERTRREGHQLPLEEKRRRADLVIENDGDLVQLRASVGRWLDPLGGWSALRRRPELTVDAIRARLAQEERGAR